MTLIVRDVKTFFDIHAHDYDTRPPESFYRIVDSIKGIIRDGKPIKLLDVGCGNGNFIKAMINGGINAEYYGTDVSFQMTRLARKNLLDPNLEFFTADIFTSPIRVGIKFDVIHIASVLHHLIGDNKSKSLHLAEKLLELLTGYLNYGGVLVVEEVYFNSYLIPGISSLFLFYGLKLINFLHLDVSSFIKEVRPGLEVNFLYQRQMEKMLGKCGSVHLLFKAKPKIPIMYRILFLKETGHIEYILKKDSSENTLT